jgi:hypothetical protein
LTTTRSNGSIEAAASASRWEASRRSARMPAWTRGWSVLTRPSSISGKPVTAATSVTGSPAARNARAVPPVETSSKPRRTSPAPNSVRPVLSETERSARRGTGIVSAAFVASMRTVRPSGSIERAPARASPTALGSSRCSTAWIRSKSDSSVSPERTATESWSTTGPPSSESSTKWTVTPVTFTPAARASRTACPPGNDGSSAGWRFRIRFGNAASVAGPTIRMYPARTTSSGAIAVSVSARTRSSSARAASSPRGAAGTSSVSIPCSTAQSSAGQSRSAKTSAISASSAPRSQTACRARRLLPAPETPTAIR